MHRVLTVALFCLLVGCAKLDRIKQVRTVADMQTIASKIGSEGPKQAAQQAGPDQQNERRGDLQNDQRIAPGVACRPRYCSGHRSEAPSPDRCVAAKREPSRSRD